MEYIWNVTGQCDLKCKYCWDPYKEYSQLSYEECCSLIDRLVEENCTMLIFTGGEPTVRSDFFDIVNYASKKGISNLKICTNGFMMPMFNNSYVQSDINEIHISVNKAAEVLDRKDATKYIEALLALRAAKKRVVFVSIIDIFNLDNYISVLKLAEELGIIVMSQLMAKPNNKEIKCLGDLAKEEKEELFKKIEAIHRKYIKHIDPFTFSYHDTAKKYYLHGLVPEHCYADVKYRVISPEGDIFPCYWKRCKDCTTNECFTDKCLVWFRYNKRLERVYQMMGCEK